MPATGLTALILAGGQSRRFGQDKALLKVEGQSLLERTVGAVGALADEVLIIGRAQVPPELSCYRALPDKLPGIGPLGGLLTGLRVARHEVILTIACDLPFVSVPLLRDLTRLPAAYDAAVPRWQGRAQPLVAVYHRRVLPSVCAQIATGDYRLSELLARLRIWWLEDDHIKKLDLDPRSFTNINVPADWQNLRKL